LPDDPPRPEFLDASFSLRVLIPFQKIVWGLLDFYPSHVLGTPTLEVRFYVGICARIASYSQYGNCVKLITPSRLISQEQLGLHGSVSTE
jgi:hypothetical protein